MKKSKNNNSTWDKLPAYEDSLWLRKSQKIALKILTHLKRERLSQVELAKRLHVSPQQVNKIIRGSANNMTLETICKIEKELDTEFIIIPDPKEWSEAIVSSPMIEDMIDDLNFEEMLNADNNNFVSMVKEAKVINLNKQIMILSGEQTKMTEDFRRLVAND